MPNGKSNSQLCVSCPKKALLSQVAQPSLCRVRVAALTATVSLGVDQLTEAGRGTAALAPHRRSSPVRRSNGQLDRRRISATGPISPLTLIEKNRKEMWKNFLEFQKRRNVYLDISIMHNLQCICDNIQFGKCSGTETTNSSSNSLTLWPIVVKTLVQLSRK